MLLIDILEENNMGKKLSKLKIAQQQEEDAVKKTNEKIAELGHNTDVLYISLNAIQSLFDRIRNVPKEERLKYEKLKVKRLDWKQKAENIEMEYKKAEVKATGQGAAFVGAAGVGAGVAVAALGPTVAMGIATTFGVASTGTAISTLSGAAATNAALAWLGGGALNAGGGGMAAGSALLALAGPVGGTIVGISVVVSGLMNFSYKVSYKERLEDIFTRISKRNIKSYELAIVELGERIDRIKNEGIKLAEAIIKIESFGTEYNQMSESQQYELGAYVNLMEASTMLLIDPIMGLRSNYTEEDFEKLCASETAILKSYFVNHKSMVILLSNWLYKIELNDKDKKVLSKWLKKNKGFMESINMTKKEFDVDDLYMIERALNHRYKTSTY